MSRLGQILKVRTGEGRTAALGAAMMLLPAAGAAVGQSGIDALFFDRSGVEQLPRMLLISGGLMFVTSVFVTALLGRMTPRRLFGAMPLMLAVVFSVERGLTELQPSGIYPVLWLSAGVAQFFQGLFTWGMVGMVVDTRQAKRLFPLFGAGGILGAVVGGLTTPALADRLGAENLLLVWGVSLVATFLVGRALVGGAGQPEVTRTRAHRGRTSLLDEMLHGFRSVRGSSVLRWMSLAAVLFSVLYFSLYLPFSRAATERFSGADDLAGFFGLFSAATTGAALVASLFLTNRLLARFGVSTVIVVLPLIYLGGFAILVVNAAFAILVAIRFVQMVWMSSVAGPAWESVMNVVPPARRDQTRAFMNGGPAQGGTIIAGLILLIGVEALSAVQLYAIGSATAALTIVATWRARRSYSTALVDALRAGRPEVFTPLAGDAFVRSVDRAAMTAVIDGASDADVRVRRVAVEILGDLPSHEAIPTLRAAVHDVDATVRAAALRSLARAGDGSARPELTLGLSDPDPAVRLAAVRAVGSVATSSESTDMMRRVLVDGDPRVRSSAASVMLLGSRDEDALAVVRSMLDSGDPEWRVLALEALEGSGSPETFGMGAHALMDPSPPVRGAAARALVVSDPPRAVPLLVRALGDGDEGAREAAAKALGRVGSAALEQVMAALLDPELAEGALRALEVLPANPEQDGIRDYAREEAARAVSDFEVSRMVDPDRGDGSRLLRDSLLHRARTRARRALRAIALLGDRGSIGLAISNLSSRDRVQVANALETLESLGESAIVRPLLRLWEPADPRVAFAETWLPQLLDDPDPWIRGCAALLSGSTSEGDLMTEAISTLSNMERVLFLRKVSLFADLPPQDLTRVAAIAEERTYVDDEAIASQGEPGDEVHIVVDGEVRVLRRGPGEAPEVELAARGPGDVVGEMALITAEPRMASVVASGDVRTLRLGREEFEGVLRERPDTAIAVIRVLSQRLIESAKESVTSETGS